LKKADLLDDVLLAEKSLTEAKDENKVKESQQTGNLLSV
jgi:hypothetical protein